MRNLRNIRIQHILFLIVNKDMEDRFNEQSHHFDTRVENLQNDVDQISNRIETFESKIAEFERTISGIIQNNSKQATILSKIQSTLSSQELSGKPETANFEVSKFEEDLKTFKADINDKITRNSHNQNELYFSIEAVKVNLTRNENKIDSFLSSNSADHSKLRNEIKDKEIWKP